MSFFIKGLGKLIRYALQDRLFTVSEQHVVWILKRLEEQGVVSDFKYPEDDMISFNCSCNHLSKLFESLPHAYVYPSGDEYKSRGVVKNALLDACSVKDGLKFYTREGTPEEQKLAGTDKMRVLSFDTLMRWLGASDKWIAMNENTDDAWQSLKAAIKSYVNQVEILNGLFAFEVVNEYDGNGYMLYEPKEAVAKKCRRILERALLTLANHPIGRQTVIASLYIQEVIDPDLRVVFTIGVNDDQYMRNHTLVLSPNIEKTVSILKHEFGHMISYATGFIFLSMDYDYQCPLLDEFFGLTEEEYQQVEANCKPWISEGGIVKVP
ncbi:MAG: hypothetical protein MJ218_02450, partial [Opitutales bacterium]|nr:hypothetical protein [Opitutales bacterium]